MPPVDEHGRHERTRTSLRSRITIWVVAVFALIQVIIFVVFLLYQRAAVTRWFDERLSFHAGYVTSRLDFDAPLTNRDLAEVAASLEGRGVLSGFSVAVLDADGRVIAKSSDAFKLAVDSQVREATATRMPVFAAGGPAIGQTERRDGGAIRFVVKPIVIKGDPRRTLVLAAGDASLTRMLALVREIIFIALPLSIVAVALAAWFIAGIAVAPIRQLENVARSIAPESIGKHVEVDAMDREVARLADELDQARARVEAGFRSQERFISNVSHELKTPIAVLLTEAQTIDHAALNGDARCFIRSVEEELRRLARLVDSFLLLTRVREGRSITTLQRIVSVNDLVMESVQHCAAHARHHNVRLVPILPESDDDIDLTVFGDSELLRTMLDNLVRNAVRFSPENEAVEIVASREGACAVFTVRDCGVGIPPEIIDRIFDRFAQAASEERRGRGHGLGLEIAQGIAELHCGLIRARNREPRGCEFAARIPLASR